MHFCQWPMAPSFHAMECSGVSLSSCVCRISVVGWFRAILPKSALIVEEEAWNAYPYTKTIYRCPFIEKFVLEIETVYHDDDGSQENVFNLSSTDLTSRTVGM